MGMVWVAFHTTLGIEVAVKFLDVEGESREDALQRFEREANIVARLKSPYIVQIIDYGVDEEYRPYLAMELLQGESLRDRLKRRNVLGLTEVTDIVLHCCQALHRAHRSDVIHRDIKPANIFLVEDEDGLTTKLLDFGVAKSFSNTFASMQTTGSGILVGTPAYMSPEQATGLVTLDGRSDLFSLALMAWRCLVGHHPHEPPGKTLGIGELLTAMATRPVPLPSEMGIHLPPELDIWFAKALAMEREDRFASAREMANALAAAVGRPGLGQHSTFPPTSGAPGSNGGSPGSGGNTPGPGRGSSASSSRPPRRPDLSEATQAASPHPKRRERLASTSTQHRPRFRALWPVLLILFWVLLGALYLQPGAKPPGPIVEDPTDPSTETPRLPTPEQFPSAIAPRPRPSQESPSPSSKLPPAEDAPGASTKHRKPRAIPAPSATAAPSADSGASPIPNLLDERL